LLGTNWRQGWNGYVGLGGYSDHISGVVGTASYNAGGVEGILGFGYQGSTVVLNLALGARPTQGYETTYFPNSGGKIRVVTAAFDLGIRF